MLLVWMNVSKNMLLSTMTYSHRLPGFLIGVLDPDVERRRAALGRIRVWYDLLQRADRQSQKDAWVRNFMFSLIWPGMTFVRETLALLCEVNFEEPTQEVLMHIRGFAESFLSTRIDEDVFNRCRQREHAQSAEQIGRPGRWHVAMSSTLLKDYDWAPTTVTPAARSLTSRPPPGDTFQNLNAKKCSLTQKQLATLSDPTAFPHSSPMANKLAGPAWCCVESLDGDWSKIKVSFQSLLATPGLFLLDRSGNNKGR